MEGLKFFKSLFFLSDLKWMVFFLQVLTDSINLMAMNLTNQVCSIVEVTKAVAGGDLMKKIEVDICGEILELKETVNGMTENLSVFADEAINTTSDHHHHSTSTPMMVQVGPNDNKHHLGPR